MTVYVFALKTVLLENIAQDYLTAKHGVVNTSSNEPPPPEKKINVHPL